MYINYFNVYITYIDAVERLGAVRGVCTSSTEIGLCEILCVYTYVRAITNIRENTTCVTVRPTVPTLYFEITAELVVVLKVCGRDRHYTVVLCGVYGLNKIKYEILVIETFPR